MSLPRVHLLIESDGTGVVEVDGHPIAGLRRVQVSATAGANPVVALELAADRVTGELPAAVNLLAAGPTASDFVRTVDPRVLEHAVLDDGDLDTGMGEGAVRVLARMAADFDDRG